MTILVAPTCNPSTKEVVPAGPQVWGWLGLFRETTMVIYVLKRRLRGVKALVAKSGDLSATPGVISHGGRRAMTPADCPLCRLTCHRVSGAREDTNACVPQKGARVASRKSNLIVGEPSRPGQIQITQTLGNLRRSRGQACSPNRRFLQDNPFNIEARAQRNLKITSHNRATNSPHNLLRSPVHYQEVGFESAFQVHLIFA